ncbi:MAG: SurA N-terminal domain-containing protein [Gaiellaceae bacterium]
MPRTRALAAAALLLAAAGCSGGGGAAVAHVGGTPVTTKQLDAVVSHFRDEAKREGRGFPAEGTTAFRQVRNRLLGLLVYREELQQAADRLGVKVDKDEVARRLAAASAGEPEGSGGGDTFAHDSVVAQLVYEGLFKKVTSTVHASTPAEAAAARNAAMAKFVARLERQTKVRYEPGYAPGP